MDGVAKNPEEPTIRVGEPLQSWVRLAELLFGVGAGHEVERSLPSFFGHVEPVSWFILAITP